MIGLQGEIINDVSPSVTIDYTHIRQETSIDRRVQSQMTRLLVKEHPNALFPVDDMCSLSRHLYHAVSILDLKNIIVSSISRFLQCGD